MVTSVHYATRYVLVLLSGKLKTSSNSFVLEVLEVTNLTVHAVE